MRYPSIKTLMQATGDDRKVALAVRKVLDERTKMHDQWGREMHRHSSHNDDEKLRTVDRLLGNHGVEWVTFECEKEEYGNPGGFAYSNTGDSYAATLVLYERRFYVTGWADMLEWHERRS